jgi:hypothetical protein
MMLGREMERHMSQVTETVSCETLRQHIAQEQEVIFWGQGYRITPLLINAVLGDGKKLVGIQPLNTRPNYYVIRVESGWDLSNWGDGDLFVHHLEDVYEAIEDQFSEIEREREYLIEDGVSPERADLAYYPEELGWPVFSLDSGVGWFELDWPRKSVDRMTPADLRAMRFARRRARHGRAIKPRPSSWLASQHGLAEVDRQIRSPNPTRWPSRRQLRQPAALRSFSGAEARKIATDECHLTGNSAHVEFYS